MKYNFSENKINIIGKEDFNPKHILECGQIFRFFINQAGNYVVFSKNEKAEIVELETGYEILTNNPEYFVNFFNLNQDYSEIKLKISKMSENLKQSTNLAHGLRILKGDLFEIIVSFIISANNNIKRIKGIINRLCEKKGTNMGEYYAFPTPEQLLETDEEFYKLIGAGYRAKYLARVNEAYSLLIKEDLNAMSDIQLKKRLMQIKGVGPKVADCIMLFGFNRTTSFPVDVWMERAYYENFGKEKKPRAEIAKELSARFGDLAGYVQQYLFYSKIVKSEN